jgi:hypothetical protein
MKPIPKGCLHEGWQGRNVILAAGNPDDWLHRRQYGKFAMGRQAHLPHPDWAFSGTRLPFPGRAGSSIRSTEGGGIAIAIRDAEMFAAQRVAGESEVILLCPESGACIAAIPLLLKQNAIDTDERGFSWRHKSTQHNTWEGGLSRVRRRLASHNPASRQALQHLIREGGLAKLVQAGARLHQTGCNGCPAPRGGLSPSYGRLAGNSRGAPITMRCLSGRAQ